MKRSQRNAQDCELLRQSRLLIATLTVPINSPECPFITIPRYNPDGTILGQHVMPRRPIPPSLQVLLSSVHDSGGYFWIARFDTTPGNVDMIAWPSRETFDRMGAGRP